MENAYPPQPPEGRLIEEAAKADGRSVKALAPLAGISDARWRHIVKGYQPTGNGRFNEVKAPAQTLARMAHVLGLDADDLDQVGRTDAAQALAGIQAARERHPQSAAALSATATLTIGKPTPDEIDMIYRSRSMTPEQKLDAIRKVLHLRAQAEAASAAADDAAVQTRPQEQNN